MKILKGRVSRLQTRPFTKKNENSEVQYNSAFFMLDGTPCKYISREHIIINDSDELIVVGKSKRKYIELWGYNNVTVNFKDDKGIKKWVIVAFMQLVIIAMLTYTLKNYSQFPFDTPLFDDLNYFLPKIYFTALSLGTIFLLFSIFRVINHFGYRKKIANY